MLVCGPASVVDAQVSGVVRGLDLVPIPDALVTIQATDSRTVSAADGSFSFDEAVGSNLVIVAARKGYFNGSVTAGAPSSNLMVILAPVPQDDDPTYTLADPQDCAVCHPDQYAQWNGSPMSKGGTNTWVHDIYDGSGTPGGMGGFVYVRDSEFAHSNPNSECAACHQPQTWIESPFSPIVGLNGPQTPGLVHGVSCDVCHKIADVDETKINHPGIYPGAVTFTRPQGPLFNQVQYGVLGDVDFTSATEMRSSFQPQLVAGVCGTCHQDKNDPDEDGDFDEPNGVISEPTYIEWLDSPYGDLQSPLYATCVDCHMPPAGPDTACNNLSPALIRDPDTIRSHDVRGTTPYFLENAVDLDVQAQLNGNTLEVDAVITNSLTGHHVPTGVTVRNMILLIDAWRESDGLVLNHTGTQTVHDLGGIGDPAQGYYAGLPGKFYAKVNHNSSGVGPTFFTDAFGIQFDNRIAALASDPTSYTFDVPPGGGTLRVDARLIYRRAFRFLVDAKGWMYDGHGNPLADVAPPHYGHLMEMVSRSVIAVSCTGQPLGASCSDGNPCNGDETCDGLGNCQPGTTLVCDDSSVCTDDSCDPSSGCVYTPNTASCDDGDACTTDDTCSAGLCVSGPPEICDDANPCTDDACLPASGCQYTPNTASCEDGDSCTTGDVCSGGTCISGAAADCDDGNACTQDICDAGLGCLNLQEPAAGCLTAQRSSFALKDNADDSKDRLKWKWSRGEAVAQVQLGDPVTATGYALCVYDSSEGQTALAGMLAVTPGPSWSDRDPNGWRYKDASAGSDGVKSLGLRTAGASGKAKAKLSAKGVALPTPVPVIHFKMFDKEPQVVVQLVNGEGTCWTSEFTESKKNKVDRFIAKSP